MEVQVTIETEKVMSEVNKHFALIGKRLKDKNGDGIREFASGKNVEFTLTVQSTPQDYQDVALVFKEDLEKAVENAGLSEFILEVKYPTEDTIEILPNGKRKTTTR